MAHFRMPYQCMAKCENLLVAARGSSIDLFNLEDRSFVSTWKFPPTESTQNSHASIESKPQPAPQASESSVEITTETPPAKKRKLSLGEAEIPKAIPQQQKKKKKSNRSDQVNSGLQAPAIIALAVARGGQQVIGVTGEDKTIRVFENILEDGRQILKQLSQRVMPKRPCAIAITDDDQTIISADKFGDVYSLPLIPSTIPYTPKPESSESPTAAKPFVPAANEFTIHSQRNRLALENQRRQTNRPSEKSEPTFEHKLLLGHVSMLTDLLLVKKGKKRYIVTADRDEHIRVSRGVPQAHVIEGFCLGHEEFVSKLCVLETRSNILISGGGDDSLFIWEWETGKLLGKADLRGLVMGSRKEAGVEKKEEEVRITVSGIWDCRRGETDFVVVACEGVPNLFLFTLNPSSSLTHLQTVTLSGNFLSLVTTITGLLVAIDTIHASFSTIERREPTAPELSPIESFEFQDGKLLKNDTKTFENVERDNEVEDENGLGKVENLLYGLENLRKREGEDKDE